MIKAMSATVLNDYRVMGERNAAILKQIDELFPGESVVAKTPLPAVGAL